MMASEKIFCVSAVRDFAMYRQCIADNPLCAGWELHPFDNRTDNLGIPAIYNRFIDSLSEEGWVVFCHEDWMVQSELQAVLQGKAKDRLYGPIGVAYEEGRKADFVSLIGAVNESRKDGSHRKQLRGVHRRGIASTFDCMCVIAHSSLLRKEGLRFDELLLFDMYVEDFCCAAKESFGVVSEILPIESQHFSEGVTGQRFQDALSYVREKYSGARGRYATTVGYLNVWGALPENKPVYELRRNLRSLLRRIFLQ